MYKSLLFVVSFLAVNVYSNDLPKFCFGQYDAVVPSFQFEDNNKVLTASAYKLSIKLTPGVVHYQCGSLGFTGTYSEVDQVKDEVSMLVSISNSISIDFDFNITVNKKTQALKVFGLKGVPATQLAKREITIKKKS